VIKAVIFDFGNVLYSFRVATFLEQLACRSTCTVPELLKLMPEISRLAVAYETGLITSDQFFRRLTELAKIRISRQEFIDAYCAIFTRIESTASLIRRLKPRYRLGLLSNTNEWHFENNIRTVDVYPLFDAVTLSYEVRAMKPAAAIYADMLQKLGLEAGACLYIDDIPEYVQAAKQLGMNAVVYTGHDALVRDLRALQIEV
jgi:FMN phosphatase YigB (HAD superfamily)